MRLRKKPWIEEAMQELKDEYVLMHDLEKYKGRWQELFPGKRLCLEIGCGKGRFIIGMAGLHPEKAFIGVETQHDIAYYPGKTAKEQKLDNIKVICANAEHLEDWFELGEIKELFAKYKDVTAEDLWANLKYFLEAIMPICEACDVKMAIHPDDPPWGIFGLPRIITDKAAVERLLTMVPSKYNGLTLCTGSLGASPKNDMVEIIHAAGDRIYFAHLRNVAINDRWFNETAHESAYGSLDMYEIVKALQEEGFDGYVRPDHGRMIWGEVARPGYGLFDRALGVSYLNGLWEAVEKSRRA